MRARAKHCRGARALARGRTCGSSPEPGRLRTPPPGREGRSADNAFAQVQLLNLTDGDDTTVTEPIFSWSPQREADMYEFNVGTDANFSPGTYSTCLTNHTVVSPYNLRALRRPVRPRQPWPRGRLLRACPRGRRPHPLHAYLEDARRLQPGSPLPLRPALRCATVPGQRGQPSACQLLRWEAADNISRYKVTISPVVPLTGCSTVIAETYNTTYVPEQLSNACTGEMRWTVPVRGGRWSGGADSRGSQAGPASRSPSLRRPRPWA